MRWLPKRELFLAVPLALWAAAACSSGTPQVEDTTLSGGTGGTGGSVGGTTMMPAGMAGMAGGAAASGGSGGTGGSGLAGTSTIDVDGGGQQPMCEVTTCAALGFECGYIVDECGNMINCADEGLTCGALEACTGGVDGPTMCMSSLGEGCTLCGAVPDCTMAPATQLTRLTGRVVTPGRDDLNVENQVGVPNAFVYILQSADVTTLPAITSGIPTGGTSCDRCEDQDLGPVLVGGMTDATGTFTLEGNIPVGVEFVLVVKAGRFRRAVTHTLAAGAACQTTALPTTLPDNPTRLARTMTDGLAVNIPRIAVSTGEVDAMECVLEKMGISATEFGNPGADGLATPRVHLYRGGNGMMGTPPGSGARIDDMTPHDAALYTDLARLQLYDIVVADCEGGNYDGDGDEREASGDFVREYVNRGGRLFGSHLSFTWLHENGDAVYDAADPIATGLAPMATWATQVDSMTMSGLGVVSIGRPQASPRIQNFADWLAREAVTVPPAQTFTIQEPRSQNATLGPTTEEFVYQEDGNMRIQQFSASTPYGSPPEAVCGRVAYSGFHVSIGNTAEAIFPTHCAGNLTPQEKVLLYMLFDLSACVGEVPPPPDCTPATCESLGAECGYSGDGCGNVLDCGPCIVEPPA